MRLRDQLWSANEKAAARASSTEKLLPTYSNGRFSTELLERFKSNDVDINTVKPDYKNIVTVYSLVFGQSTLQRSAHVLNIAACPSTNRIDRVRQLTQPIRAIGPASCAEHEGMSCIILHGI